ncbi:Undecaprenyl-phosphate galactose phosphotransferase, WbaP/exopolysaccharide biosynthesis polyprenyl glycosylphosphotransferase [Microbacterium pygmaeum]|uniref:Undecaprenyl-phosphate galactose phosphotransferase, WbaP/exopolysaccharide biosynthesis polyprenyl glycosylphosphotransferase n=1 Tax=Microbacterium pygmaeum TaxID=370764 RepID=A0A1G8DYZ2_9MICO|nr:sugar transferase [Microbacterium pygmaeum]SDH62771.1 Undecaprenyl-phosphate galactose phosphotransferase, WbaP/exopolysaccharide biosynthesis polyprenyl glycosylphosphotransferase [Microbacterium pygmaeum]
MTTEVNVGPAFFRGSQSATFGAPDTSSVGVLSAGDAAGPERQAPSGRPWTLRYARRLWLSDLVVLIAVVYAAQLVWFGTGSAQVAIREDSRLSDLSYWFFSAVLVIVWMVGLTMADSRSTRMIGNGATEYARVANASFVVFSVVIIACFLARIDVARGYLLIALPLGALLLILERYIWRKWLLRRRARGEYSSRVLLVGSHSSVAQIARELRRTPGAGYFVVGACVPTGQVGATLDDSDIPIMGNVNDVSGAMRAVGADTVVVTSTDELPPFKVKQISWGLEAGRQHLVLAPSIVDIAGPRLHTRPVSGLPLIHVETPNFSKGQRFLKRATDLVAASLGVLVLSPVFAFLAMSVRLSSDGPVLFRQKRIGLRGREFTMLKFRSMVQNAEDLLPELAAQQRDAGNEVLFKMTNDPRITPIGRIMRKFSLDELPQLFNVIGGSMSLVGPRPPLPSEVEQYADHVHRRFLAKPGITGAWQVSGRSTLSWEDSVRLDLSYVENWTLLGDLIIVLKTGRAVFAPGSTAH